MAGARAIDVLVFDVGDVRLAIDLPDVIEVSLRTEVAPLPGVRPPVTGVVRWRGQPLMAVQLRARLGLPAREAGLFDHFVIVRTSRRVLALEVDRVSDVAALPSAEVRGAPASARPIAGVVARPDGVHYVVDLEVLVDLEQERTFDEALARREARP